MLAYREVFGYSEERLEFSLGGQLPLSGWPHNPTTRFWPPSTYALRRVIAVPAGRDGDRSTQTCVPVESHKRCLTSSIPVRWQSWLVACPSCWKWWCCCVTDQLWRNIEDAHDNNNNIVDCWAGARGSCLALGLLTVMLLSWLRTVCVCYCRQENTSVFSLIRMHCSCRLQGDAGSKNLLQQNPPVLNWL